MVAPAFAINQTLRRRLDELVSGRYASRISGAPEVDFDVFTTARASANPGATVDVVVTMNEVNDRHGTGPLVERVLRGRRNIFSIRARNDWGEQEFGDWHVRLPQPGASRPEWFLRALSVLGDKRVRQIICVPVLPDELKTSIAIQAAYGVKLCAWIMDDYNVSGDGIPDELMREFLERCSLRLATHPELSQAYERKYSMRFHILPAVVPAHLISTDARGPVPEKVTARHGALFGSFWEQRWFDDTCETLAGSGSPVDWYGNNRSPWLRFPQTALKKACINPLGIVPESQLPARLRDYPFLIVPAGKLDESELHRGVASLSLPGRILFAVATANVPIIILGSESTCGARFVRRFELGDVVPYAATRLAQAIDRLLDSGVQHQVRLKAAALAPRLSDEGVSAWLEESIERGAPADRRFEELFQDYGA